VRVDGRPQEFRSGAWRLTVDGAWRTEGMAEATVRRMHAILHAALTQAVRWDLITSNAADRIEPPRPRKSRRKAPPDDVLVAILAATGDDMICYLRQFSKNVAVPRARSRRRVRVVIAGMTERLARWNGST
jgi:hypothetical protein